MLWCSDYEDKDSLSRFFCRHCHYFRICGNSDSCFCRNPGIKLGLANLSVLIIMKKYGFKDAALVSVVRILVIGFLFGNMFSILYSLAGAALSLSVMVLLLKKTSLTTIGISVFGGVTHNIGQLIIAALIVENTAVFYYTPPLLISGVVTGFLIGVLTQEVLKRLPSVWGTDSKKL